MSPRLPERAAIDWRAWGQRFLRGFLRPFELVRRLRQEPVAWAAYRRTVAVQAALTLAAGSAYFVYHLPAVREEAEPVVEARSEAKAAKKARVEAAEASDRAARAADARARAAEARAKGLPPPPDAQRLEGARRRSEAKALRRLAEKARKARGTPGEDAAQAALEAAQEALGDEAPGAGVALPPVPPGVPAPPPELAPGTQAVPPGLPDAKSIKAQVRAALEQAKVPPRAAAAMDRARAALEEVQASPEAQAGLEEARAALEEVKASPEAAAALEQARAALEAARASPGTRAVGEKASAALEKAQSALEQARAALPHAAQSELAAALEESTQASLEAARERAEAATERLQDAKEAEQDALEKLKEVEAEATLTWWRWLGAWVSSLVVAQWVVLGLSRDFQDRIARDLSLVAGLQPEDVPPWTRIRVDAKWLWRKARRKVRGALAVGTGVALLSPLILAGAIVGLRHEASSAVLGVVSAYWWVVFSAARSARAWRLEADLTPPRPLRALFSAAEAVPLVRGWLPRLALTLSRRFTGSLWAPARAVEEDFATFAGLAVARLLATLPVVRIALRAPLVVAAGETIEASLPIDLGPAPALLPPSPMREAAEALAHPRSLQPTSL